MDNELKVPNHIAIILDGNGRWAKNAIYPRGYGHIVGCDNLEKCVTMIKDMGVKYLTVYAFSTEELETLPRRGGGPLKAVPPVSETMHQKTHKNQMRVKIIGDPSAFRRIFRTAFMNWRCSKDYDHM